MASSNRACVSLTAAAKEVWLQTSNKAAFQAGLESGGVSAFVFGPEPAQRQLAAAWGGLARFRALHLDERGLLLQLQEAAGVAAGAGGGGGQQLEGNQQPAPEVAAAVGEVVRVDGAEAARALEARVERLAAASNRPTAAAAGTAAGPCMAAAGSVSSGEWVVVLDASDWKVIPAENLVALAQNASTSAAAAAAAAAAGGGGGGGRPLPLRLLAAAGSAADARLMLEALQAGTAGVLLRSDDPAQVRELVSYVRQRAAEEGGGAGGSRLPYQAARVTAVTSLGMGDRACVDLAGLLQPGEGLLVGNFARCLALVHSECDESSYIASRPFRVNAGPVHAYVSAPGGRTRYLSELASGAEVTVADPEGRTRTALVGRVKIERRPLVLVEVETVDGARHSLMLQNAETVKLVGPCAAAASSSSSSSSSSGGGNGSGTGGSSAGSSSGRSWRAISVSTLQPGDSVYALLQAAARHTGIAIEEFVVEK
ncbi:hypothetical protein HYH02_008976 [Chlamydomonas schloesseri]|uniref:3-dehydroquinate synthase n=1 Tax=Chlamydomonas schloesseri TaxID=2026947 RepID=A0A835WCV2_9CHLO|nr:hypothetical protein HYH02_008976 [Chlamydomonas schloesseri]|eukprot:KAG2445109.1 hypothetical protein HYH02_008976 [Chlamydomonas schloesseri]